METEEHFYADDPSRGPADGKTTLEGVDYFFLGNGRIQAAVQVTRAEGATPVGLLIMDPERFGPKRAALTFDGSAGIAATAVSILIGDVRDDRDYRVARGDRVTCEQTDRDYRVARGDRVTCEQTDRDYRVARGDRVTCEQTDRDYRVARGGAVRARWLPGGSPRVEAAWRAGAYRVTEIFFCPDGRTARLLRRVSVTGPAAGTGARTRVRLRTGVRDRTVEAALSLGPGETRTAVFEYRLVRRGDRTNAAIRIVDDPGETAAAAAVWSGTAACRFHDPLLDRFFAASKFQLRAAVSAAGRLDGGVWQYNLEWVRDQSFIALALAMSGQTAIARTMFARLLDEMVDERGATMDSSRFRPWEESEFDQNGVLLFALASYLDWTGDRDLVAERWERIARTADFALRPAFRHEASGLLMNRREFWERHDVHGIETGMELAHQLYVAMGLRAAGRMAALLGRHRQAAKWTAAADLLREAMLRSPRFSLVEAGRFIKRRGLDGRVQAEIRPDARSSLPREAPLFEPGRHLLDPDTAAVLPVAWEFVDPGGVLARRTLASMETIWDQRWTSGGYGRYNATSEADSPGPWPFASLFVARAAIEAGDGAKARRVLDWLGRAPGARAASWFEFYGPRPVPPYPQVGIIPWTWAEMIFVFIHHLLGVRPAGRAVRLRPKLLPGERRMEADLAVRDCRLELSVRRARRGEEPRFEVDARRVPYHLYGVAVELPERPGRISVRGIIP